MPSGMAGLRLRLCSTALLLAGAWAATAANPGLGEGGLLPLGGPAAADAAVVPGDSGPPGLGDLPKLQQTERTVLAAITGGWSHTSGIWASKERLHWLASQLHSYVHMCEQGWEVHVVLVAYRPWPSSTMAGLHDPSIFHCSRLHALLPVVVSLHDVEPLPPGTTSTGGTLSSKHRLVFLALRDMGYQFFVNQVCGAAGVGCRGCGGRCACAAPVLWWLGVLLWAKGGPV